MLDQAQDQVGGRDGRLDTEHLEMRQVAGVVDARDDALHAVLLLGDLADQDVVLIVAGDGDHKVGALDARPLQNPQLTRIPILNRVLELLLDHPEAVVIGLDQRHLTVLGNQLAGQVPPHLARPGDDHIHVRFGSQLHSAGEQYMLGLIDRHLRRTDRLEPLLRVPGRPRRIGNTHDNPGDVEAPLCDL